MICIIPDIHARLFWKEAVEKHEKERIIFLGDYLDPYKDDFPNTPYGEVQQKAIDNFKEIIEFKKSHMDNVTLLVGNHDLGYFISPKICSCRSDRKNYMQIRQLFLDNKDLFEIAAESTINGQRFIFSHSGIRKDWMDKCYNDVWTEENCVELLNNDFYNMTHSENPADDKFADYISIYSKYRGYGGGTFGSVVWSDLLEWVYYPNTFSDNTEFVFGHTYCSKAIKNENWALLDCGKDYFLINDDGEILHSNGNKLLDTDLTSI